MSEPPERPPQPPPEQDSSASSPPEGAGVARFIGAVFGLAFAGIGLTVILSLWFGGMGDPPVFFKLFGSFIGTVFVAMGGGMAFSAITGRGMMAKPGGSTTASTTSTPPPSPGSPNEARGYTCPHCGGGLDRGADISPMGDVKCAFCG